MSSTLRISETFSVIFCCTAPTPMCSPCWCLRYGLAAPSQMLVFTVWPRCSVTDAGVYGMASLLRHRCWCLRYGLAAPSQMLVFTVLPRCSVTDAGVYGMASLLRHRCWCLRYCLAAPSQMLMFTVLPCYSVTEAGRTFQRRRLSARGNIVEAFI